MARGSARHLQAAQRRRQQQGVRPVPSWPLAPFLSALLAGPPVRPPPRFPPARPGLAPSARLRCRVNWNQSPRPRDSHNAQRAARHIPSRPSASVHPSRAVPALTPTPRLIAPEPSALCNLDAGRSVPQLHGSGPLPSVIRALMLDAGCRVHPIPGRALSRGAPAERPPARVSACVFRVTLIERLLCAWPSAWDSSLEAILLTQGGRHNCCYQQALSPPQPMQTSRAPQSPPLSVDISLQQTFSSPRSTIALPLPWFCIVTPRSLDLLCTRKPLVTSIQETFTIEPS